MKKYILITILLTTTLYGFSWFGEKKDNNSPTTIPTTLLPAHKTVILQSSNNYTDTVSITYPKAENIKIEVTSNNPNVLLNGTNSTTLFFTESNYNDPQQIHFSTALKSVTNVCLGQEFQLTYNITNQNTGEITVQTANGYIIDENHSTNFYLNPNGSAPLTVTANIITNEPTTLEYSILNK